MKMNNVLSLAIVAGLAGTAFANTETNPQLRTGVQAARGVGHIYINARTGERVITTAKQAGDQVSVAAGDVDYWLSLDGNPCTVPGTGTDSGGNDWNDYGYFSTYNTATAAGGIYATAIIMDWGDVPFNSKIAGFQYSYGTDAPDVNGDFIADQRIDSMIFFVDGEDGRQNFSSAGQGMRNVPSAAIWIGEMPGTTASNSFGLWTITIDLSDNTTGSAAYFELGDNDGVLGPLNFSDASMAGVDLDAGTSPNGGTGNADFGWGMYCFHYTDNGSTGTASGITAYNMRFLIGTGDGVLNNTFVAPQAVGQSDAMLFGQFIGDLDTQLPVFGGIGAYTDANVLPDPDFSGFYLFYGGLDCSTWPGGLPSNSASPFSWGPYTGWLGALYTLDTVNPCVALDINNDLLVNFSDVLALITAFQNQDPIADINGDGLLNLADITAFIDAFAGCQGPIG